MTFDQWEIWYDNLTPYDPPFVNEDSESDEELDQENNPLFDHNLSS